MGKDSEGEGEAVDVVKRQEAEEKYIRNEE